MDQLLKKLGISDLSVKVQVNANLDISQLALNPEEGFLLSRVDASSSLEEIFKLSPFDQNKTKLILEKFAQDGVITSVTDTLSGPKADPELIEFYNMLINDKPDPRTILGVSKKADSKQVKKAYIALSRKYHPDHLKKKGLGHDLVSKGSFIVGEVSKAYAELKAAKPKAKSKKKAKIKLPESNKARAKRLLTELKAKIGNLEDTKSAVDTLKIILTYDPNNEEAKNLMKSLEPAADRKKAEAIFKKACKFEEMVFDDEAKEAFENAIQLDPENAAYLERFANFLVGRFRDYNAALPLYQKVGVINPKDIPILLQLACCFEETDQGYEAKKVYRRILNLDRKHSEAKAAFDRLKDVKPK